MKQDQFENENGKWVFNENVTLEFEDMLNKSIPQYEIMREMIFNIGCHCLNQSSQKSILDLGCSNGLNLQKFIHKYGALARFKGVDISKPMLNEAIKKYQNLINCNIVSISYMDLRDEFPLDKYTLIMSILTIQFIPIEYRQKIIQNIYNHLEQNGMFIFVEKVLGNCHEINSIMVDQYYKLKHENGYSYDEIERKKKSLEGVLVPMTSDWNIDLLKQAGFRKIDVFWRWMNFEGYIAIK